ncbi:reverse transcriptase domain-containing protein [Tanacetum coccineum]|uniref:Reverse transcriptase domain-containing protein n=1 Tax=Tanacetum coccineum TaxID=301880 RepID=A0ABQ4WKZ0_9ASTR
MADNGLWGIAPSNPTMDHLNDEIPGVPEHVKLRLAFPFSLEDSAGFGLEKDLLRSILTWDDLVSKFINQFFPPSKTTNLRNEITRFQQRFDGIDFRVWIAEWQSHSTDWTDSFKFSTTLTPFGDSDFLLLEEVDAFLALADDPTSPEVDKSYYDLEGTFLFSKHSLIDLPPHLEYAFLEDNNKLPVIIAKDLSVDEKTALIKVLKSRKRAIVWILSDINGINPEFCSHKIIMEEDYEPAVQHQRRVHLKIHDVIKKEVEKLLDARLIYPILDSPWTLKKKLTEASILIAPDWDQPFELMCDASDYAIGAVLGKSSTYSYLQPSSRISFEPQSSSWEVVFELGCLLSVSILFSACLSSKCADFYPLVLVANSMASCIVFGLVAIDTAWIKVGQTPTYFIHLVRSSGNIRFAH